MSFGWIEAYVRIGRRETGLRKYRVASRERTHRVGRQIAAQLNREFKHLPQP